MLYWRQLAVVVAPAKLRQVESQPLPPDPPFCPQLTLQVGPESFDLTERNRLPVGGFGETMEAAPKNDGCVAMQARRSSCSTSLRIAEQAFQLFCFCIRDDFRPHASVRYVESQRCEAALQRVRGFLWWDAVPCATARHGRSLCVRSTPNIGRDGPHYCEAYDPQRPQDSLAIESGFMGNPGARQTPHEPL